METKQELSNKKKEAKKEKFFISGIEFKKEFITQLDNKEEFKVDGGGKSFKFEIIFNEDRNKFHVISHYEGKRQSLSFFNRKIEAYKNINIFIKTALNINAENQGIGN